MNLILLIAGILLVLLVVYDLTYTTLAPRGAGVVTSRITNWVWKLSLKISGNKGRSSFLSHIGYTLLYTILSLWILIMWFGNTLIFYSDPQSLVDENNQFITDFADKFYYVGYVLSTMGSGEYRAASHGWQIYAAFLSFTGLVFITTAISYLVPIVNAVAEKRALANYIAGLGKNPFQVLQNSYDGQDYKSLEEHFNYIIPEVLMLTKNHQAYPALHYFHESDFVDSISIYISNLDEVISILLYAVDREKRPKDSVIMPLRRSLTLFLQTLHGAYLNPSDDDPGLPDKDKIEQVITGESNFDEYKKALDHLSKRRRTIFAYLRHHGWSWNDMYEADFNLEFE